MTPKLLQLLTVLAGLLASFTVSAQELTIERYDELETAMDEADVRRAATSPGTAERDDATAETISTRRTIIQFLSDWIASGELNDDLTAYARNGRTVLIENLIQIYSETGECDEGSRLLVAIADLEDSQDPDMQAAHRSAVASVDRCEEERERARSSPTMAPRGGRGAGVALTVVGSAMAVGGAVWNLALLDDRREFRELEESCTSELDPCNERAEELSSNLGVGPRIGIIGLVVGGVVAGSVGIRAARRSGDLIPIGTSVSLRNGGGSVEMRFQW
jgi:hypothetical protein